MRAHRNEKKGKRLEEKWGGGKRSWKITEMGGEAFHPLYIFHF